MRAAKWVWGRNDRGMEGVCGGRRGWGWMQVERGMSRGYRSKQSYLFYLRLEADDLYNSVGGSHHIRIIWLGAISGKARDSIWKPALKHTLEVTLLGPVARYYDLRSGLWQFASTWRSVYWSRTLRGWREVSWVHWWVVGCGELC